MKKTLIAMAALAATGAFAQVTISGVMDAGYKMVDAAVGDNTTIAQNGTATSAIVLGATEDLGGGMKASVRYEMNPDFVAGAGLAATNQSNGYNFVGVSGNFGSVLLGRLNTSTLATHGLANPFGTAVGSGYATMLHRYNAPTTGAGTAPTRFNGAIEYSTPMMSGFQVRALYVPKVDQTDSTANNRQGVTDLGLSYANGPLAAAISQQAISGANAAVAPLSNLGTEKSTLTTMAASYQLGAFKLAAGLATHKQDNSVVDTATTRLSGTYTAGAVTGMLTWAKQDDKLAADADRTSMGLGVDYALSKTTAVYFRYEATDTDTTSAADDKTTTTMVGLRKSF